MSACPFHYSQYRATSPELIDRFIDAFPLAILTSHAEGRFCSSHIPLLRQADGSLFGHVDGGNPQFRGQDEVHCQIIFMGPSAYIPPEAYVSSQLPTWNYLAVHMQATVRVSENAHQNLEILKQTAQRLATSERSYHVDPADPRVLKNLPHILGLSIHPLCVEGRFKLSQDKTAPDALAALNHLLSQGLDRHHDLLADLLTPAPLHPIEA
ncbi:MAG: FMN-binding negative transcriptional regulator [Pseudomonas sp.]|jgi:transcriptional regulator|uniref:FMN-binding negative transcriptional regulator n=1 Tax=Pseudomonas entomophila TaxID=312306 RepID=UPI0015E45C9F|nr:FMN-binding negative transcriptional regulator [Pseudomonas entomophila]MBA1194433.1 FMN-binding negative transcriptional regulator [Pseudomonas entomophila]MDF2489938.1 FMN-binding negative transcriptional regulator [Pseudomonas sp.]